jgi:dolichyl-diphosphooligosaccharide--protein glycosyltransferase
MYKFCCNKVARLRVHRQYPAGFDFARQMSVQGMENIQLSLFEEAFTTKNWIVRIYRVAPDPIWDRVY